MKHLVSDFSSLQASQLDNHQTLIKLSVVKQKIQIKEQTIEP